MSWFRKKKSKTRVRDVICGMEIDPNEAAAHVTLEGVEYYFCCEGCLAEFKKEHPETGPSPKT